MWELFVFIVSFLLIYSYYRIFVIRRKMEFDKDKMRFEIALLVRNYKLDFKKLNYKKVVRTVAIVNALLMSSVLAISSIVDSLLLQLVVMVLLLIPLIYFSYSLMGRYYFKKMKEEKVK